MQVAPRQARGDEGPVTTEEVRGDAGVPMGQSPELYPGRFTLQHQNPGSHWSAHCSLRRDKRALELPRPLANAPFIEFRFLLSARPIWAPRTHRPALPRPRPNEPLVFWSCNV